MNTYLPCGDVAFFPAIKQVLKAEGGLTHDLNDSGGWTNYGICQSDINPKTNQTFTEREIKALDLNTAEDIYRANYWKKLGCSKLPYLTSREVFDWGVNAGVNRAISTLQKLIWSSQTDGLFGEKTLNDLKYYLTKHTDIELATAYAKERDLIYRSWGKGSQSCFLEGWLNRNNALARELGLKL